LVCPFCGAPQRRYVPADAMQVKCQYCGGIFLAPPWMGGGTYRCFSHPERLAIGKCNDCGESFCGDCLHVYKLSTEGARAILYLCPKCLRKRYVEKAVGLIYFGVIFLLFGVFAALVSIPIGVLIALIGVGSMIYGSMKREETLGELTIAELQAEKEKRKVELATVKEIDLEEIYSELLTQYVNRWGTQTGIELLESEIMAYTRHGVSFQEAVKKVYQRQIKKPT